MNNKIIKYKKILLFSATIIMFFSIFKYFKGKSLFDTLVEYQNDIYSENAAIESLGSQDYSGRYEDNIPDKYNEISKINNENYVMMDENTGKIILYNSKDKVEEVLTEVQDKKSSVFEAIANEEWVIWGESLIKENEDKIFYKWSIWAKSITNKEEAPFQLDKGNYEKYKSEQRNINSLIPDSLSIDNNKLLYRKIARTEFKENNIISDVVTSELVLYDLSAKKLNSIYGLGDVSIELISNPKIDNGFIAFEKKSNPNNNGIFQRTEVYSYNINSKEQKKIYENEKILSMDLKNNNIVILSGNIDPSILICNLTNSKKINIAYKGSKIQKYFLMNDGNYEIYNCEFIDDSNIVISYKGYSEDLGYVIYNIPYNKFYSLDNDIEEFLEENKLGFNSIGIISIDGEIRVSLGSYLREEVKTKDKDGKEIIEIEDTFLENDKTSYNNDENQNIKEEKEVFKKYLIYKLK